MALANKYWVKAGTIEEKNEKKDTKLREESEHKT